MEYELAKKLKDAGFPQRGKSHEWCIENSQELLINPISIILNDAVSIPTLSELIEECGDKMFHLGCSFTSDSKEWEARTPFGFGKGSTPEEAVANLWLELNKKS